MVRLLGLLVSVACCVYVARALFAEGSPLSQGVHLQLLWPLFAATLCWMGVNTALGLGWGAIARTLGTNISAKASVLLSYRTQVAKYLPGNVFHHVGRVVLAKQLGIPASIAGVATLLESLFLVGLAALLGLSFLFHLGYGAWAIALVIAGILILGLLSKNGFLKRKLGIDPGRTTGNPFGFLLSAAFYVSVFLLQAVMFTLFLGATSEAIGLGWWRTLEMVSLAWGAGFVVIGAPGGLGVREAAYALFANTADMKMQLLYIASWLRVSSILGDLICFILSKFISNPSDPGTPHGESR